MIEIAHVDDNADDLEITEIHLKRRYKELKIHKFMFPEHALESLISLDPDCILSDYQMPRISGLELLQKLRRKNSRVPFIFFTGQGNEEVAREALRLGANDYFTKEKGIVHYERLMNSILRAVRENRIAIQREAAMRELQLREQGYRFLLQQTTQGIYRTEIVDPIDITLPVEMQIQLIYERSVMVEANDAIAKMYGYHDNSSIIGKRLTDFHGSSIDETNWKSTQRFIDDGYKIVNAFTKEFDRDGRPVLFINNVVGIVENGKLVRIWGSQAKSEFPPDRNIPSTD